MNRNIRYIFCFIFAIANLLPWHLTNAMENDDQDPVARRVAFTMAAMYPHLCKHSPASVLPQHLVHHIINLAEIQEWVESTQEERNDALRDAAKQGLVNRVQNLLAAGADINTVGCYSCNSCGTCESCEDKKHWTPLHLAAKNGHEGVVYVLLEKGANVNVPNCRGYMPLHLAAANGHEGVVYVLLEKGANVNAASTIITSGSFAGLKPLHLAAANGHDAVVRALLAKGADIDVVATITSGSFTGYFLTPLYLATTNGYHAVVRLLLQHTPDLNKLLPERTPDFQQKQMLEKLESI